MIAVSDSSPLITLAQVGCFDLLNGLFTRVYISAEVHNEVVVVGTGLPGASEVAGAEWVEVQKPQDQSLLLAAQQKYNLGVGELSAILLAKQLRAGEVLLDDSKARKLASAEGLRVRGSVGLLEAFYRLGYLHDLPAVFRRLLAHSYIDRRLLDLRLRALGLPPL